jgi:hypothetical protein
MAKLEAAEQRFASITAEITSNVLKITKESVDVAKLLQKIDRNFDDAKSALTVIEDQIKAVPAAERSGHQSHLNGFQKEFKKLRTDYTQAKTRILNDDSDLVRVELFEPEIDADDRHALMSDTVGGSSRNAAFVVTEEDSKPRIASITRSRDHMSQRSSKASGFDFNRSTRIATILLRRAKQSKLVVYCLSITVILVLMVVIFRQLSSNSE